MKKCKPKKFNSTPMLFDGGTPMFPKEYSKWKLPKGDFTIDFWVASKEYAVKMRKAREAVIQAAKKWHEDDWLYEAMLTLAVKKLLKLESEVGTTRSHPAERGRSKGAKDGK